MPFEMLGTVLDNLMQVLIGYTAYRFYEAYKQTDGRVYAGISVVYAVIFMFHLPYLVLHHYLGYPFAYGEELHEFLFIIASGALVLALSPRVVWKKRLEQRTSAIKTKGKKAA